MGQEKKISQQQAQEALKILIKEVEHIVGKSIAAQLFLSLCTFTKENFFPRGELVAYSYFKDLVEDDQDLFIFFTNFTTTYAGITTHLTPTKRQQVTQAFLRGYNQV